MADVRSGLESKDFHLINEHVDPDFSPERNQAIINKTIRDTEAFFAKEGKAINDAEKERFDILSTYGTYRFGRGTKSFIDYFGKENYYNLVGERIMSKVRIADSVNKLSGKPRQKGILL